MAHRFTPQPLVDGQNCDYTRRKRLGKKLCRNRCHSRSACWTSFVKGSVSWQRPLRLVRQLAKIERRLAVGAAESKFGAVSQNGDEVLGVASAVAGKVDGLRMHVMSRHEMNPATL